MRRTKNRRRGSAWSRLPNPSEIADACGRAVRRSLRAMAAIGAGFLLAGVGWAGYRWITSSPRFAITAITIQGAHRIDPDQLRAQLPVHLGDNAFTDLTAIGRAVRAEPWIASAEVHRILPSTIALELHEHTAAAVVELGGLYLADPAGRPFKRAELERGETEGLPLITGLDHAAYTADPEAAARTIRDAIAAAAAWSAIDRPPLRELHIDPHGVTLHAGAIAIQLGASGLDADALAGRMRTFDAAWAGLTDAERSRARQVHLGARPDHVTVAFANGAKAAKE